MRFVSDQPANDGIILAVPITGFECTVDFARKSNKIRAICYTQGIGFAYWFGYKNKMGFRKKVLIAEDYADIRAMTRIMVEAMGFEVVEASNGAEAIEKAKKTKPDAVLMDIAMPVLNGITAASMIHQLDDLAHVPIIAVTAYGREYVNEAGAYGFDAVIQKPVDIDDLELVLQEKLDTASARKAVHRNASH